jgi:hypothetical protein
MRKYILLAAMLLLAAGAFAQKKKDLALAIDTLMAQQRYERSMPLLRLYLAEAPEDAFATYRLGQTYHELLKELYLHQREALQIEYDSAISIYERALSMVDKKEVRRNKDYYYPLCGVKDFDESHIRQLFEQSIQDLEGYFGKMAFLQVRLAPIQTSYAALENGFRSLTRGVPSLPHLHRMATDAQVEQLLRLQTGTDELKRHIAAYEAVFDDSPELRPRQFQQFGWQPVEGMNFYPLSPDDFAQRQILLFDFAAWSKSTLDQVYAFRKLAAQALALDQRLQALEGNGQADITADTASLAHELLVLRQAMLPFDQHAGPAPLLAYRLGKLRLSIEETQVRRLFASAFPDEDIRNGLIDGLTRQALGLSEQLKTVPADSAVYLPYGGFLKQSVGTGGVARWKILEGNLLSQRLLHWNGIRAKGLSLPARMPDAVAYNGSMILMRPAQVNLTAAQDSGYYIAEDLYYFADSSLLVKGRCGKLLHVRPFLARIDTAGQVRWMRDYPDTLERAQRLEHLQRFADGSVAVAVIRSKEGASRMVFEALGPDGQLLYSRVVLQRPDEIFYTTEPKGVVLLRKAAQGEGGSSFQRIELEGFSFQPQSKPLYTHFLLRGELVGAVAYPGGLHVVANFLEYQDADGNFSDSRAYSRGGFNVLAIKMSLKQQRVLSKPFLSMEPTMATHLEGEPDGKLRLIGFQGEYRYHSLQNVTGGRTWQQYVE